MALPSPAARTTTTNFDAALKQIYRPSNVKKLTFDKRPGIALLPKFEGFGGRNMPVVVKWGHPMGRSITFATAQAVASQVKVDDFLLTRVSDYSVNYIDAEALESTRGDTHAFLRALSEVIDGTLEALADSCETKIFRAGTGTFATMAAGSVADPMVFLLQQIEEITNVEYNMQLVACATDGGTARTTPAQAVVAGVNRTTGAITTDYDNSGGATNWAAGDYIACKGDLAASAGAKVAIAGFASWLPATAPTTGDSHFSVDRSVDSRLYGLYHDASGGGKLEEHFIKAQSKAATQGGGPDVLMMHHSQLRRLNIELGAKKTYGEVNARDKKGIVASIGFRSIVVDGDHGDLNVVPANKCQATIAWALTVEDWTLATLGPMTKIIVDDGLRFLRTADADAYEIRSRFRGNVCTKSPIRNVHIALPTPT